jgi:3-keto-L-gulonate-6-phosphate decarboxylase
MFSMLGCATDQAVSTVLEMASRHHIEVVFDMQSIADPAGRSARLKALGAQQLCVHKSTGCGENLISSFREYLDIQRLTQLPMAVAGGITLDSFYQIKAVLAPTTTIIGHAVQDAEDNMEAIAQQFRLLADQ